MPRMFKIAVKWIVNNSRQKKKLKVLNKELQFNSIKIKKIRLNANLTNI